MSEWTLVCSAEGDGQGVETKQKASLLLVHCHHYYWVGTDVNGHVRVLQWFADVESLWSARCCLDENEEPHRDSFAWALATLNHDRFIDIDESKLSINLAPLHPMLGADKLTPEIYEDETEEGEEGSRCARLKPS